MESMAQDVRYGFRMLVKNPGFTVVAVLTLVLGIGANTAIFSRINGILMRGLPVEDDGYRINVQFEAIGLSRDFVLEKRC
jgi:hypothetical protein